MNEKEKMVKEILEMLNGGVSKEDASIASKQTDKQISMEMKWDDAVDTVVDIAQIIHNKTGGADYGDKIVNEFGVDMAAGKTIREMSVKIAEFEKELGGKIDKTMAQYLSNILIGLVIK